MREVLLVRALGGDDRDAEVLRGRGVPVVEDPYLVVESCTDAGAHERAHSVLDSIARDADWLIVTSQAALRALVSLTNDAALREAVETGLARGLRVAAVGEATAQALQRIGAHDVLVPAVRTARGLAEELAVLGPQSAVAPQGSQAMKGLASGLRAGDWTVDEQIVYVTSTVLARPTTADDLAAGRFAAVVLRSPTAVRAVSSFVGALPAGTVAVCGGPTTADAAQQHRIGTVVVSPETSAESVADTVLQVLGDETMREST